MNKIEAFLDKNDLSIRSYQKKGNISIIDTNRGKYVIKNKFLDDLRLYSYLDNRNFPYLLDFDSVNDYDIYPYIEEVDIPFPEKGIELVYILSLLHNKTTYYREVSMDDVKKIYEDTLGEITYLDTYYHELQDIIEQKVYMSPEEYLLIRNISFVYSALNFSRERLEEWYKKKSEKKKERVVLLHNKPCLEHLLIGDNKSLISWEESSRGIPIYDFIYFYKHDYMNVEMSTLFDIYQSKFLYTEDEYLLFLSLISIPGKLKWGSNHYSNSENTYFFVRYVTKTRDFILKENEKTKKEDE